LTRILLIPIAGTIAALIAITLARQPRGEAAEPELPAYDYGNAPEHAAPPEDETEPTLPPEGDEEPAPAPAPEPREFQLRLEADGTVVDSENGTKYASIDKLAEELKDARHTLVLTNGKGVTEKALDDALVLLRDHFKVLKVYSAPEAPPGEGR